jgi:hypothetical protein
MATVDESKAAVAIAESRSAAWQLNNTGPSDFSEHTMRNISLYRFQKSCGLN